ncbi:VIT1/CCC1 transporter family protein [Nocardiopsis coralliicola]
MAESETGGSHAEPSGSGLGAELNRLRAGVLGAQDGVVSTAGLVVGVAGASASTESLLVAGVAGLLAGALSMGAGEYVSVSTQRDTEKAAIAQEKAELAADPDAELEELSGFYEDRGLTPELAREVAEQLTAKDALRAHAEVELRLDANEYTSPWAAAFTSFFAFALGALVPLLAIMLSSLALRLPLTFAAALVAVTLTGAVSAYLGGASPLRAALRCIIGSAFAMAVTYAIGTAMGGAAGV